MNTDYDSWAAIYDEVYSFVDYDINFYLQKASNIKGNILEIGCGTGRITIPLMENGANITGIDSSQKMIDMLGTKVANNKVPIKIIKRDVRDLELAQKFSLVIFPYRGFQSLLTVEDQVNALNSLRNHLEPGGKLIITLFVPGKDLFDQRSDIFYHLRDSRYQEDNGYRSLHHRTEFDHHNQLIHTQISITEHIGDYLISKRYADFTLRYLYTDEARYLFEYCGFKIEEIAGDYDGTPYDRDSEETIWSLVVR